MVCCLFSYSQWFTQKETSQSATTAHWSKGYPKNQTRFCTIFGLKGQKSFVLQNPDTQKKVLSNRNLQNERFLAFKTKNYAKRCLIFGVPLRPVCNVIQLSTKQIFFLMPAAIPISIPQGRQSQGGREGDPPLLFCRISPIMALQICTNVCS